MNSEAVVQSVIALEEIKDYARRVVDRFQPEKIILFGSQAHGLANSDSDVDLMVVMQYDGKSVWQALKIWDEVDAPFPIDLIVQRRTDVERRIADRDFFMRDVIENGMVLYDAARP